MKIKEKIKNLNLDIVATFCIYLIIFLFILSAKLYADELLYKFKSPSFSGVNTSSHYLTIENQEATRRQAIKDEIQAYKDELARDASNTTLARFIRNLESRVYAQLSRQMVEQLFGETQSKEGKVTLEGNTIEYVVEEETITLTITDEEGSVTNISLPIGSFTF